MEEVLFSFFSMSKKCSEIFKKASRKYVPDERAIIKINPLNPIAVCGNKSNHQNQSTYSIAVCENKHTQKYFQHSKTFFLKVG